MDLVVVCGKSRKNIQGYILIPPETRQAMDLLISTRSVPSVHVHPGNLYMFARINAQTAINGCVAMKETVSHCPNINHPQRITSTKLRKYVATVCQILDMKDNELQTLAVHLGHDVKTHKEYYRLSNSTNELSTVSQLLYAVESGCVNEWRNFQLKDINILGKLLFRHYHVLSFMYVCIHVCFYVCLYAVSLVTYYMSHVGMEF